MAINTHGGGANTNKYGLKFEQDTSLSEALINAGYEVIENYVCSSEERVALIASKYDLYRRLLTPNGIDWKKLISKRLFPEYRDVHQYIKDVGCHLFFNEIPIDFLNL